LFVRPTIQTLGFYTTRFVESGSAEQAIEDAIRMVRDELSRIVINPTDVLGSISVDAVWEDELAFDEHAPGAGFSWYPAGGSDAV
jgi:hypothetical protein